MAEVETSGARVRHYVLRRALPHSTWQGFTGDAVYDLAGLKPGTPIVTRCGRVIPFWPYSPSSSGRLCRSCERSAEST